LITEMLTALEALHEEHSVASAQKIGMRRLIETCARGVSR
jgi:hypothetical protein